MTSTGRINYIDELKGFILCLVCLGHIAYSELSYVMNWMSLMRMFTFFFLSGLLFSRRRFPTFKDYAISKTKHLLFPYIWLSLFFLIITFPIYAGHIDEASRGPLFIKIREFEIKSKNSKLSVIDKLYVNGGLLFKKAVCRDSRQGVGYKVTA